MTYAGHPISDSAAVAFAAPLPEAADVVVIGGGVIGVMTAWFLAGQGRRVVLCEKGRIAGEQSSRNWGWVRQQGRDLAELPIMIEAMRHWQDLQADCGEDLGFRRTGVMYLADTEAQLAGYEDWLAQAVGYGLDTRMLSGAEVAAHLPAAARQWQGALWTPGDARAEPLRAVPALARACARRGVHLAERCAVRGLDLAAGRVAGVVTERGRIRCDQVVLAGGAWSALLLAHHGVRIPQLSVKLTVAATLPMPEVFAGAASCRELALRRQIDGGYTLAPKGFQEFYIGPDAFRHLRPFLPQLRDDPFANRYRAAAPKGFPDAWGVKRRWAEDRMTPFEATRVLNPAPNLRAVDRVRKAFAGVFPGAGRPEIARAWAGMIDTMPDIVPVIDHVPALPGLTLATGMSGHGFGIGPGVGRVVADLVCGRPVGHDLTRFRFGRFSDGSPIELGPAL